jgi:hypothetical protein
METKTVNGKAILTINGDGKISEEEFLGSKKIVIEKNVEKKHKTTRERLIEFYGEDFEQIADKQEEIDWGGPVGEEIW